MEEYLVYDLQNETPCLTNGFEFVEYHVSNAICNGLSFHTSFVKGHCKTPPYAAFAMPKVTL